MIEKILLSIKQLPAFPTIVHKVSELLKNDDYDVNEVVNVIKYDQAITANILKISNSAYFGVRQKIKSIHDAVIYLGQKNLLRALQTVTVSRIFAKRNAGYGMKTAELWEHSVSVALMSQILSRKIIRKEDAVLYTAALLHDVGKLVMGEYVQESSQQIFAIMSSGEYSFLEAEEIVIGINHADLGGRIAVYWNFPPEIHDAIAYHHRPDRILEGDTMIPSLVYIADQFCLMMGIDGGMDGLAHRGITEVMKKYGLKENDLEESMLQLFDELEQANELLHIVN
ncbi:MAG: HDOD domain-containing protein [Syntrophobacterales bacterium]|nr:HDOD domain-containing protein [Syntrophobacterales bacterium]